MIKDSNWYDMIIHVQLYMPERKKYGRCHLSINANLHLLLMYT